MADSDGTGETPADDAQAVPSEATVSSEVAAASLEAGEMSPEQLAESKEYGKRGLVCHLIDQATDLVYVAVMALFVAVPGGWLISQIDAVTQVETLRLLILAAVLVLANNVVSFPLSFYSGHILEHQYGLSRQTFAAWLLRYAKWRLVELSFLVVLVPGLYWIIWLTGSWWWLVGAVAYFFVVAGVGMFFPNVIMPIFHKYEKISADDPRGNDLLERMRRLATGTGLSIEGVYRMGMSEETVKANAMLAGMGSTRRVILGDNLLDKFTSDEIEVVIAHEVGHHVYRHLTKFIVGIFFSSLGAFYLCDVLVGRWLESTVGPAAAENGFPYYTLPMMMLIISVFSLVVGPLKCAISRSYEYQCDRYAVDKTGLHDAFRTAFEKLSRLNKDDPDPHPLEVFLFHDHPPVKDRIAASKQ